MKIGLLVGAAGLALAGVAYAAEDAPANLRATDDATNASQSTAKRLADFNAFAKQRDAILGAAGSAKRGVVEDEMRALIGAGVIDPKRSLLLLEERNADDESNAHLLRASRARLSGSGASGGAPGMYDFGQNPPFVFDGFESYKTRDLSMGLPTSHDAPGVTFDASNGSIVSQVAPWGPIWDSDGFTPDASNPEMLVVVSAADPALPPDAPATDGQGNAAGQMLGYLRSLTPVIDEANNDIDITDDDLTIPTASLAIVVSLDYYLASRLDSFFWVDFASLQEGFVSVRYFTAGFPNLLGLQGNGTGGLSNPDAPGIQPIVLGTLAGNFTIGQFYDNTLRIPTDEWVSIAQRFSLSGQSMFHKTSQTDGSNGVLVTDRATSTPFPGLEMGWAETYPGKPSDCLASPAGGCAGPDGIPGNGDDIPWPARNDATPPVPGTYLGTGVGQQADGFPAPQTGDAQQAPLLAATSHDFFQFHRFNDPPIASVPSFVPNDIYLDNLQVTGTRFVPPEPIPDQVLPFVDDMERWIPGPIRLQAGATYFDALSSRAAVITTLNTTPPPGSQTDPGAANFGFPSQSIQQVNQPFAAQNTFREDFDTTYPTANADPIGPDGIPGTGDEVVSVSSVQVRVNNTTNMRAIQTSGQTTLVMLGTVNPNTGASDNRVYVRVPNFNIPGTRFNYAGSHAFDPTRPETLSQNHWRSELVLANDPTFNDNFWNYEARPQGGGPGSFTVPTGTFFEVRVEIPGDNPENLQDQDENLLFPYRLFVDGTELCPPDPVSGLGDCVNHTWVATAIGHNNLAFFTGSSKLGLNQSLTVDDIKAEGKVRFRGVGPAFTLPYVEDFEGYAVDPDSLNEQGPFPFLRAASVPDSNIPFYPDTTAPSVSDFCRYQITEYLSASQILDPNDGVTPLPVGTTIAIPNDLLPTLDPADTGCPGVSTGTGAEFTFIAGPTQDFNVGGTQLSRGKLLLLNPGLGGPADPADVQGFRFDQHQANRWRTAGADSVRLDAPAGNPDANSTKSLRVVATGGTQDENNFNMSDRDFTFVPEAPSPAVPGYVTAKARMTFDMFIEGQPNPDNGGVPFTAPLQRYSLQVQGIPASGNREDPQLIAEARFGGPDLNPDTLVPSDEIALFFENPNFPAPVGDPPVPQFLFESTGVTVPMNQWFRVGFELNRDTGTFSWFLDTTPGEDIFTDPATDAIVLNTPNNPGVTLTPGVTSIGSLQYRIGDDEGGNGFRIPPKVMVQGARNEDPVNRPGDLSLLPIPVDGLGNPLNDPWNVPRPAGASAGPEDWCVYEVDNVETTAPVAPLVQEVDGATGALGAVRVIANQDLIAVFRRDDDRSFAPGVTFDDFRFLSRQVTDADIVDAPGPNFGQPILPDCPSKTVNGSTDDGWIFLDDNGAEIARGQWTLEGQPGQAGVNDPFPNGGIKNDTPPYNGGPGEPLPDGTPGSFNEGFRNILLAQFYMTPDIGADLEPQRWFIDNITVVQDCDPIGAGNLLTLLGDFGAFGTGALLDLLGNWNSVHPSCQ